MLILGQGKCIHGGYSGVLDKIDVISCGDMKMATFGAGFQLK
jgi:hypothetical protein